MANRGFCLPGLGYRLSILTLGFTVGLALGLLWASPARSWNSVYPAAPTVIRRGLTHLQRQLSAIKNNSALASALKRPLVMAKLQAELSDQRPQYAAVIFCVIDMFEDSRIADNVDLQVNSTWGRHCNHLLFVTNYRDMVRSELTLFVNNPDSESARQTLFRYLQQANVSRDTQWFLWSTVMSFVIVENLRYLVHNLNASEPAYLGPLWAGARIPRPSRHPQTFAFNRAALESIVKANCSGGDTMARCLRMAGVKVLDSRDDQGCARFLDAELTADKLPFRHALSPKLPGQCVSTTFVSVQTGGRLQGLLFEYLTHVLTPYGLRARLNVTDARIPWNASSMPNWNSSEKTRPSTSTTTTTSTMTTRPIKEIRQGSVEPTFAPATFNKIQNLTLAEANSAALRRFSVAFNSTQKPSTTNDGGRTRVRSSDVFNSTLESQISPK